MNVIVIKQRCLILTLRALCVLFLVIAIMLGYERMRPPPTFSELRDRYGADPYLQNVHRKLIYEPHELKEHKKILVWSFMVHGMVFRFGLGAEPFERNNCAVKQCFLTTNHTLFPPDEVAAVIRFHPRFNPNREPTPPQPVLSPNTMNIFTMFEYPSNVQGHEDDYKNNYNWTLTYRSDSDFRTPYGIVEAVDEDEQQLPTITNYAENKTMLATWLVSHCSRRGQSAFARELYVNTLKLYIPVNIYGRCGTLTCGKFDVGCEAVIYDTHKFFFAFENSVCKDYVTEKLFRTLMNNIIPVTFGLGYDKIGLPEKSYIDVFNFESVLHLADYLKYLDGNDTAYNEYFAWKGKFKIRGTDWVTRRSLCDVCASLHQMDPASPYGKDLEAASGFPATTHSINTHTTASIARQYPNYRKTYPDVQFWIYDNNICLDHETNEPFRKFLNGATKSEIIANYDTEGSNYGFVHAPNQQWP